MKILLEEFIARNNAIATLNLKGNNLAQITGIHSCSFNNVGTTIGLVVLKTHQRTEVEFFMSASELVKSVKLSSGQ